MRAPLSIALTLTLATALAAGCGSTKTVTKTVTVDRTARIGLGPPSQIVEFGYVKSLTPKGGHFELRFDPALLLSGETANRAAAQDGAVSPGEPVPNDNYVLNDSKRLVTYFVPADARVTVLTNKKTGILSTPIKVSQLADLVAGKTVPGVKLFELLDTGFWIRIRIDTVRALDQQYHP